MSSRLQDLPNVMKEAFELPKAANLGRPDPVHPPRLLILYGSLRKSHSAAFSPWRPPACSGRLEPKFTRGVSDYLTSLYSERKEELENRSLGVDLGAIWAAQAQLAAAPRSGSAVFTSLSITVKVEPFPGVEAMASSPRWRFKMCLTMASPSPVPPFSRLEATSTR